MACAQNPVLTQQCLQAAFVPAFVKNNQGALGIPLCMKTPKEEVAAVAYLFEGPSNRVLGNGLLESNSKQGYTARTNNLAKGVNNGIPLWGWTGMPRFFAVGGNGLRVEFNIAGWKMRRSESVYFIINPIDFSLKDGNSSQDEVLVIVPVRVTRLINVKQVHRSWQQKE